MPQQTDTAIAAYQDIKDAGEDVILRRRVAAAIGAEPQTINELAAEFPEHSANAIRPRVNELVRMGCVERDGKRQNPSGHDAYVHHLTTRGEMYVDGHHDPEPGPTISELKGQVVDTARAYLVGMADEHALKAAIKEHDQAKRRMDPEWTPSGRGSGSRTDAE